MPDLGRWNGIDQLAEAYTSTSTYAYVANNPVLMTDPDGRWMDDSGHIIDTTGQTFGFLGSSYKPQGATNYLGVKYGDGGGDVAALLARAGSLGGTWSNTGFGFLDSNGTLLGYDGSYKSLNVNFDEAGIGEAINYLEEVFVTGKKGGGFGEGSYNSYMMDLGINKPRLERN